MTQGPKTPSPTSEASLDDEKISPSEDSKNPRLDLLDPHLNLKFGPYKNRTQVKQIPGTQDPSAEIAERFPLDANL